MTHLRFLRELGESVVSGEDAGRSCGNGRAVLWTGTSEEGALLLEHSNEGLSSLFGWKDPILLHRFTNFHGQDETFTQA